MHLNGIYMSGSDFVERGKFREIRDKIEKNHTGPIIIIYRENMMPELQNQINSAINRTNMYCRPLQTNLDSYLNICVPENLKNEILHTQGEKNEL